MSQHYVDQSHASPDLSFNPPYGSESESETIITPYPNRHQRTSLASIHDTQHDVQGIDWQVVPVSRDDYREQRLGNYRNYRNIPEPEGVVKDLKIPGDTTYFIFRNSRLRDRPNYTHFQLRNLLWASSKNDVYFPNNGKVMRYCPLSRKTKTVLSLSSHNLATVKISTMCVAEDIMMLGGFTGEYILYPLWTRNLSTGAITQDVTNGITNYIQIIDGEAIISSNDYKTRMMDLSTQKITSSITQEWPVNCTVKSDNGLLCIVGDCKDSFIVDGNGKQVAQLTGHHDYSFAAAWQPGGHLIVTGNQDVTARVYDIRKPNQTLHVLPGAMGAIRSLRWHPNGKVLVMSECADFVHAYSTQDEFRNSQVIDMFGELAGISFTPDGDTLFVGNADESFGCIAEYDYLGGPLLCEFEK